MAVVLKLFLGCRALKNF